MRDRIMKIVSEICNDRIVLKNGDLDLFETGLLDSMSFIEMLVLLEEEFDILIKPEDIDKEKMNTPNRIVEYVIKKING